MAGNPKATRRGFLRGAAAAGAGLGAGALLPAAGATASGNAAPAFDLSGLPMRQDDPRWGRDLMWNRRRVIRAARAGGMSRSEAESLLWDYPDGNSIGNEGCQLTCLAMVLHLLGGPRRAGWTPRTLNRAARAGGMSRSEAESLLWDYPDGNSIGNEGCQLTCLAMVLHLLAVPRRPAWTPRTLNRAAHEGLFYTLSGLGMNTLYADLVSEVSDGAVQLAIGENFLPGEKTWKPAYCDTAPLVRAYRSLTPGDRAGLVLMLKTGTYDDTMASHYVLLDPNSAQPPGDRNAEVLDPAMPAGRSGRWTLSDSAKWITQDPDIRREWRKAGISDTQVGGAWLFARCDRATGRPSLGALPAAWAAELAS